MKSWPHAPSRQVNHPGSYIVTGSTYGKKLIFNTPKKLTLLEETVLRVTDEYGWRLQSWAVFGNHYHFMALSPETGVDLSKLVRKLHANAAREVNKIDDQAGRQCFFEYWDTHITNSNRTWQGSPMFTLTRSNTDLREFPRLTSGARRNGS